MTGIAAWLMSMIVPILGRIMVALGVSLVTYTGITEGVRMLIDYSKGAYQGLPSTIAGLAGLAGVGEGLGLILGAIVARVALWTLTQSTQWVFKK